VRLCLRRTGVAPVSNFLCPAFGAMFSSFDGICQTVNEAFEMETGATPVLRVTPQPRAG
jgi:hypothetical protein